MHGLKRLKSEVNHLRRMSGFMIGRIDIILREIEKITEDSDTESVDEIREMLNLCLQNGNAQQVVFISGLEAFYDIHEKLSEKQFLSLRATCKVISSTKTIQ